MIIRPKNFIRKASRNLLVQTSICSLMQRERNTLWTLSLCPRVGTISLSHSAPGEVPRPNFIAGPSNSWSEEPPLHADTHSYKSYSWVPPQKSPRKISKTWSGKPFSFKNSHTSPTVMISSSHCGSGVAISTGRLLFTCTQLRRLARNSSISLCSLC